MNASHFFIGSLCLLIPMWIIYIIGCNTSCNLTQTSCLPLATRVVQRHCRLTGTDYRYSGSITFNYFYNATNKTVQAKEYYCADNKDELEKWFNVTFIVGQPIICWYWLGPTGTVYIEWSGGVSIVVWRWFCIVFSIMAAVILIGLLIANNIKRWLANRHIEDHELITLTKESEI